MRGSRVMARSYSNTYVNVSLLFLYCLNEYDIVWSSEKLGGLFDSERLDAFSSSVRTILCGLTFVELKDHYN